MVHYIGIIALSAAIFLAVNAGYGQPSQDYSPAQSPAVPVYHPFPRRHHHHHHHHKRSSSSGSRSRQNSRDSSSSSSGSDSRSTEHRPMSCTQICGFIETTSYGKLTYKPDIFYFSDKGRCHAVITCDSSGKGAMFGVGAHRLPDIYAWGLGVQKTADCHNHTWRTRNATGTNVDVGMTTCFIKPIIKKVTA